EIGELVDLVGRIGRGLDLDPAANAVEDGAGIEGVGRLRHAFSNPVCRDLGRTPPEPRFTRVRQTSESNSAMAGLDGARPQVRDGAPGNDGIFQIARYLKPIR